MAKRKNSGNARSVAKQSKSRLVGRTHMIVDSGIELDARPSTTVNQFDELPEPLQEHKLFHATGVFWSQAYGCWRAQFWSARQENFQLDEEASIHVERRVDMDNIAVLFPPLKDFSNFELLISRIRDVMRESETKGYCFVVWNGRNYDLRRPD